MIAEPPVPQRVPTLTEVVAHAGTPRAAPEVPGPVEADIAPAALVASTLVQEARIAEQVLATLQPHIDLLFEHRMRDALAPALARVYATLSDEIRNELAGALREVVARAVAEELARHRDG
jgi:hypothetical protein